MRADTPRITTNMDLKDGHATAQIYLCPLGRRESSGSDEIGGQNDENDGEEG